MEGTKFIKYLKEYVLECSICNEQLNNPKSLPCLHVFCENCIGAHIKKTVSRGQFSCPTCEENHVVPDAGMNQLRDAFLQRSLVEVANYFEKRPIVCSTCDTSKTAKSACMKCGVFLCADCKSTHASTGSKQTHTLVTVDNVSDIKTLTDFQKNRYRNCQYHEDEQCKLFCIDDGREICSSCRALPLHKLHDVTTLETKLAQLKKQVDTIKTQLESNDLKTQKQTLSEALKKARKNERDALEAMSTRVQYLSQMILQFEKQVTEEIKRVSMAQQDTLQTQLQKIETYTKRQTSLHNRIHLLSMVPVPAAVEISQDVISEYTTVQNLQTDNFLQEYNDIKFVVSTHAYANIQSVLKSVIGFISSNIREEESVRTLSLADMPNNVKSRAIKIAQTALWKHRHAPRNNETYDAVAGECREAMEREFPDAEDTWQCQVATLGQSGAWDSAVTGSQMEMIISGIYVYMSKV